jgi:hypothetical protein
MEGEARAREGYFNDSTTFQQHESLGSREYPEYEEAKVWFSFLNEG